MSDDRKWYRVSLRLSGDSLPIVDIQKKLHLAPSRIGRKGEYASGNPRRASYETNVWTSAYLTSSDVPFEEQIGLLLDILEARIEDLREILSLPDVQGNLFLGFSSGNGQGGDYFPKSLLQRIVNCGLPVTLDLYPPFLTDDEATD